SASVNGVSTTVTTTAATYFAAPTAMTTGSLTTSLNWNTALELNSVAGPNTGDTASTVYDPYTGRPSSSTSPDGATTTYTYNDAAIPPTRTATTTNGSTQHGMRTSMDGFGRTVKIEIGDGSGSVKSIVNTNY